MSRFFEKISFEQFKKDIKDDKECVDKFINTWMENDSNYYHSYEINYLIDEDKKIYAISLATMSGW